MSKDIDNSEKSQNEMFYLYRIKVVYPVQGDLFSKHNEGKCSTGSLIKSAVEEMKNMSLDDGAWLIGNIEFLDSEGIAFNIGKKIKKNLPKHDPKKSVFVQEDNEEAPNTQIFIHLEEELCAIAHSPNLAAKTVTAANKFIKMLNLSQVAKTNNIKFTVQSLKDPTNFIEHLESAYSVENFAITFTRPNPINIEKDIYGPLTQTLQEAGGEKGKASFSGKSGLDTNVVEKMARSVSATGDNATAKVKSKKDEKAVPRSLKENPLFFVFESPRDKQTKKGLLEKMLDSYRSLQNKNEYNE